MFDGDQIGGNPVVPLAGTWIEIPLLTAKQMPQIVVPLAGTWIEITTRWLLSRK